MEIQIFGTGALANELKYGILSGSYKSITSSNVQLIDENTLDHPSKKLVIGIQDPTIKKKIYDGLTSENKSNLISLIHSNSNYLSEFQYGKGLVLNTNSVLSFGVTLGLDVLINWNVTIGHRVVVGNHTSIGPGCNISGEVAIGDNCFLGSGVIVNPGVIIGNGVRVGAGAVVTKNITSGSTVVGVPARPIVYG